MPPQPFPPAGVDRTQRASGHDPIKVLYPEHARDGEPQVHPTHEPEPRTAAPAPEEAPTAPEEAPTAPEEAHTAPDGSAPRHDVAPPAPEEPASSVPAARPAPATAPSGSVVQLRDVSKDYGEGVGVRGISLEVAPGTILGIVGPSGAGKTTVVRMITGAVEPTEGEVRVLGEDPRQFRRRTRERVGYMPQLFTLYPDLTADENVDFVASMFGMLWPRRRRRVREVLKLVELWDARGRRAGQLSGGMQRRLELACALVHDPDLLLLDEPTAGIDPILRQAIWTELARLKAEGRTLLVTTQYVTEAESCDMVALVADGRLVELDGPEQLRRRAAGGDIIEVTTQAPFDPEVLVGKAGITSGVSTGLRTFRLIVEDAGRTMPEIDDLVEVTGGEVTVAREVRLSFDEVFTALVEASAEGSGSGGGDRDGRDAEDAA